MAYTIAVAGKGGSGKTSISSLVARFIIENKKGPVLAVDADPNANFNVGLGLDFEETIADLREQGMQEAPAGMSKLDFVNMRLQEAIVEGDGVDLLVMGRPEGSGCYCAVNHLLRDHLSKLAKNYRYVIIDNEAGMEHLSRRTTDNVDVLLLVSEPTVVGVRSAARALETAQSIRLKIDKTFFILNRAIGELSGQANKEVEALGVPLIGVVPFDALLSRASETGASIFEIARDAGCVRAVNSIMEKLQLP